ncbi:unnamed protein product [Candidula unifasciata]|uniref:Sodium channel modifier 1 n=1 Tax=Candidula unifasciata TaxID=100452 RepID=A0A8S3YXT2_9EUPU|nr:unnamed protein product [Candidula unifasciata]
MSFKREGNDAGLLETLRKRRINELLSEEIPEDEAKLLCNGRFTCTVCPSNPVFDTVNVLSIHRQGKKHLSNLEVHIAKKRELKQLIAARKHQQYLKDGTTTIKMAVPAQRGIITSCPYDPRVKKSKVKQGERRPILEIGGNRGVTSTPQSFHQKPSASPVAAIVDSSICGFSVLRNTYEQSVSGPIMHDHQLKNIFSNKLEEPVRITPYQSKFRKNIIPLQQSSVRTSLTNELPCTTVPQINALRDRLHTGVVTGSSTCSVSLSVCDPPSWNKLNSDAVSCVVVSANKSSALEDVSSCISNLKAGIQSHGLSAAAFLLPPPPPPPPLITSTKNCSQTPAVQNVAVASGKSLRLPPPPPVVGTTGTNNCSQTPAVQNVAVASGKSPLPPPPHTSTNNCSRTPTVQNVAVASGKSLQPPPSGWKRDWDGKWIKDENAEFDSDEEAPDIP